MTYNKQTWVDGDKTRPLSAARLAHMETQYETAMADVAAEVGDPESPIGAELRDTIDETVLGLTGGSRFLVMGDSISTQTHGVSAAPYWAVASAAVGVERIDGGGVPGERMDQIAARIDTTIDTYNPAIVGLMGGMNDAIQGRTLTQFQTATIDAVSSIIRKHRRPLLFTSTPRATVNTLIDQYNAWLRVWAPANRIPLVDANAAVVDPVTGALLDAYDSGDGYHPNPRGHRAMARVTVPALSALVRIPPVLVAVSAVDETNLVGNALMIDGATTQATGWLFNLGSATPTYSLLTKSGWRGRSQRMDFTSEMSGYRSMRRQLGTVTPGNELLIACRVGIAGTDPSELAGFTAQMDWAGGPATTYLTSKIAMDMDGVFIRRVTVPAGATSGTLTLIGYGYNDTITYDIGQVTVRDLTLLT